MVTRWLHVLLLSSLAGSWACSSKSEPGSQALDMSSPICVERAEPCVSGSTCDLGMTDCCGKMSWNGELVCVDGAWESREVFDVCGYPPCYVGLDDVVDADATDISDDVAGDTASADGDSDVHEDASDVSADTDGANNDVDIDTTDASADMPGDPADGQTWAGCTGACLDTTLAADFGGTSYPFERASYGLTHPDQSGSGAWEIYLEAYFGGDEACPDESSPPTDRTLILAGIVVPASGVIDTGLAATLLDFEGSLLSGGMMSSATAVRVTITATDVCETCVGAVPPADPDGFVSLDLNATFPQGTVSGHLFATHCDSQDLGAP